jgi:hypothetical protein
MLFNLKKTINLSNRSNFSIINLINNSIKLDFSRRNQQNHLLKIVLKLFCDFFKLCFAI